MLSTLFDAHEYAFQFISNQSTKLCRCSGPMVNRNHSMYMYMENEEWRGGEVMGAKGGEMNEAVSIQ